MTGKERYINRKHISGGRCSTVFKAERTGLPNESSDGPCYRFVALKITTPSEDRPPHHSRDELKILQLLQHEQAFNHHIIQLLDFFEEDLEDLVMVFPYYPYTLQQYINSRSSTVGNRKKFNPYLLASRDSRTLENTDESELLESNNLPLRDAKIILKGIVDGLAFLHERGIIHRDIKPENILFKNFEPTPIIIDFGISYVNPTNFGKEPADDKICDVSTSIYRAPELIFRITSYSYPIDIWSLGIVMTLIFSKDCKPGIKLEDYSGDFALISKLFETFGVPTIESWPEARKSLNFQRLQLEARAGLPLDEILPTADDQIKNIFAEMMIYESSARITAKTILDILQRNAC